jgi:hypothetical protein
MRVKVRLRREAGAFRPPYGQGHSATGDLHLTYRTADGRRIQVMQLLGADQVWPSLFDPRLIALSAGEFQFVGIERHENAWVLQQWDCELL